MSEERNKHEIDGLLYFTLQQERAENASRFQNYGLGRDAVYFLAVVYIYIYI
jgi:hypothetical protein